jgi:L-ascorbate metabolism protein UlaG (beta-lactamase superfamily)
LTAAASLTWLGHSTVVVDLDGTSLVTDPVLSRRVAHLWRAAPAPAFESSVDIVLVSHLHWDHLHLRSLERLARGAVAVVPANADRLVAGLGFTQVVSMRRGDILRLGTLEIEATHAEHPVSRRAGLETEAVGYLIRGSRRIYFAGDTDLFDEMSTFGEGLDVALLPVAGWGRTTPSGHLDALRAVCALELLHPKTAIPIHWGTFAPLGISRFGGSHTAAEDFRREAARRVPQTTVHILRVGGSLVL